MAAATMVGGNVVQKPVSDVSILPASHMLKLSKASSTSLSAFSSSSSSSFLRSSELLHASSRNRRASLAPFVTCSSTSNSLASALRRILGSPGLHQGPACHDALSAKLVENAGFTFTFMSGFAVAASRLALPDTGLISYGEMVDQGTLITSAVSIPVIGDADNGYGNALNVKRTVKGYIKAGFAGILLEDQGSTNIVAGKERLLGGSFSKPMELPSSWCLDALLASSISIPVFLSFSDSAQAESSNPELHQIYGDLGAGLELGIQVLYLAALLGLVGVASFFVVKQLLIRRELESAARDLQDRVRTGEALAVEYFELGAVMLRKKFYVLASKYLEKAISKWDGDPQDLAQVHNALGYSLVSDNKVDRGIAEYQKALKLQPGYVVAWNNLGSAYEKKKNLPKALEAYEQALLFDPNNSVAREYRDALKKRVDRLTGVPIKYE